MGVQQDLRTPFEIFDDMLADDYTLEEIAARLSWDWGQARRHYIRLCHELGEDPDAN